MDTIFNALFFDRFYFQCSTQRDGIASTAAVAITIVADFRRWYCYPMGLEERLRWM